MIDTLISSIYIIVPGELLAIVVFWVMNKKLGDSPKKIDVISILKGILERVVILTGLLIGFPQVLILFGALKIGTRIKNDHPVSNDYYFIGNMTSVLLVLVYYILIQATI